MWHFFIYFILYEIVEQDVELIPERKIQMYLQQLNQKIDKIV